MKRFALEPFLFILAILMPPVLAYFSISLNFLQPFWLPVSLIFSTLMAVTCLIYFKTRWVEPFNLLIAQLYGRQEKNQQHKPNAAIEKLERAINFSFTQQHTSETDQIEYLQKLITELKTEQTALHTLLDEDKFRLESERQELKDEQEYLDAIRQLATPALRLFIGAFNRAEESSVQIKAAEKLSFLLDDAQKENSASVENLYTLIDSTLATLAPLLNTCRTRIHLSLAHGCPLNLEIMPNSFRMALFRLILEHLRANSPGNISIQVSFESNFLFIQFSETFSPRISLALDELISSARAEWRDNRLKFPASLPDTRSTTAQDCGLSALIVTDNDDERSSLMQRLSMLGVTCTTNFKSEQLDMCLVADENSDTFLSIRPYLPDTAYILLLNNQTVINRPFWIQLDDPVTQVNLAHIIEHIGHARDESRQVNVLIVDDSVANARLLELQLTELGHPVTKAVSGQEAIDHIRNEAFQLVFMDIQMPDMNGVEATRRIRELGSKVSVFGLTAHATSHEKEVYRQAGMDDVLIKPVRLENLKSILRRLGRFTPRPPIQAPATQALLLFDIELSLRNANHRPELAAELLGILIKSLPEELHFINENRQDIPALKKAVHKLHGAVRYCGVPRLARAIEKLETTLKQGDEDQLPLLLNLLNGEITALESWYRENTDPFSQRRASN